MERTIIIQTKDKIGTEVFLQGWVHSIRLLGKIAFLILRDRSGLLQVVIEDKDMLNSIKDLQVGSVLEISGSVSASEKTELGVEVLASKLVVINKVTDAWPVEINKPTLKANLDTILDNRALTLRHEIAAAIFRIQGTMAQTYREYMINEGFVEFFGPAMIASSSEGGAEIFKMNYFGKEATLAQSNQLYKQMMVGVYERVFGMAKWFRAENSNTRRHLTEGMQYEFELGFIKDLDDILVHLEAVLREMLAKVEEKNTRDVELLKSHGYSLVRFPESTVRFPKYKFTDAIKIFAERTGQDTTGWDDLTTEAERELCEYARERYATDFIFVTNYPKGKFYAYKDENGVFQNFDLLCRDAEIVSGGRRVDNYDSLIERIKAEGMDPAAFSEYLSIFKFGMPPHGGFGLGFERFTMLALGLENIREASLFPSDTKRVASQSLGVQATTGADSIQKSIKQLFVEAGLEFQVLKHEATPTSEDAARVRGLSAETGVKALILKNKKTGENVLINIPAHKKLNIKKFLSIYEITNPGAKVEFEKPEVIKEKYGLIVGGVPPFGEVFGIKTYADSEVFLPKVVAFNNAEQTESLITSGSALEQVLDAVEGDFID